MSRTKSVSALAGSFVMLAASCWFVTGALPLWASPQSVDDGEGVAVETGGMELLHRSPVAYPRDALAKGIQGTVVARVKIDESGNVTDASVLSGPDELRKAVLQSVLTWHFSKGAALSTRQISVTYTAPDRLAGSGSQGTAAAPGRVAPQETAVPPFENPATSISQGPPRTVRNIVITGVSDEARSALLAQLPVHEGDELTPGVRASIAQTITAFDEHLTTAIAPVSPTEANVIVGYRPPAMESGAASGPKIRVGGNVQALNLISKTTPVYPPSAKAARVQGIVKCEVTIGKDGTVQDLQLLSGPPLLVQAATDAVRQWIYKPTLLNGQPVDVITTVDINFTLSR